MFVLAAAILWSVGGVVAKGQTLPPIAVSFYRSLFAGLALLPFVPRSRWAFRPAMVPLSLIFGAMIGVYIEAIARTTAANAILLQFTAIVWTVPASLFLLKERPDRRSVAGIAVATVGIAIILAWGRGGKPGEGLGMLLGLASGIGYAAAIIGMRSMRDVDPIWLSAVTNLGGALALGAFALVAIGPIPLPTGRQWPMLIAFGVVQMAIPYALFARGLKSIGAPEAGLISLLEPVLNPIWVVLVHGERPSTFTIVGGLLLLAGVAVRYVPWGRQPRPENTK